MTTRPPTSHIAPFGLRMQPYLRAQLEEAAQKTGRSLNAEIIARLDESLSEAPSPLSDRHVQQIEQYAAARRVSFEEALHMLINSGLHPDAPLVVVLHLENGTEVSKLHEVLDAALDRVPKKSIVSVEMPTKAKTKKDRA